MWRPIWVRGGKVEEVTWIGKEVLAWCSGMYIVFFHITQKCESFRWCSKNENEDGVSCLSGHPMMHLLAFSGKNFDNPKIFVLSYPSMAKVSECLSGSKNGYLSTAFTPADHLISLGSNPTYSIIIWAWRTGEKLSSVDTSISDIEGQMIRVTHNKPTLIAQLGRRSGKLTIWETCPAGKTIILTSHEVVLPKEAKAHHMDWSSEASGGSRLAIVDSLGNIYTAHQDGSDVSRIVLAQRCGICLEYEAPSVCWFRDGIVIRTTFCQIRFYKKDENNFWRKEWYVKSILKPCVLTVHPAKRDRIFYHTQEGYLMELNLVEGQGTPVIEKKLHCGAVYNFVDLVYPWGHHILTLDDPMELAIMDCYDGRQVARLDLEMEGKVTQISAHPDLPLAVVTSELGEAAVLSLRTVENPFLIAKFHLQSERLDLIKYSQSGNFLVVGQRTTGVLYCMSLSKDKPFVVTARIETKRRIADVLLYDNRGHLKLFILVVSSRRATVGNFLIIYEVQAGRRSSVEPAGYLELPYMYQYLHYAPMGTNFFIGTPYLSRQIHLLQIMDGSEVNLVDAMASCHQVRRLRLCTNRMWIISSAFDGLVELRDGETSKVVAKLAPHHRRDLGTIKAVVKPTGDLIVALGYGGSLVGMRLLKEYDDTGLDESTNYSRLNFNEYQRMKQDIFADYSNLDPSIVELLSKRVDGFPPVKGGVKNTWAEWNDELKYLEESEKCSQEKLRIETDFARLQDTVIKLLNENEACDDIEKLPIAAFDLDKFSRDQRLKAMKDKREDRRLELESNCVSMDRVANWIQSSFWDLQKIPGQSIFSIFDTTEVTNYSTINDNPDAAVNLELARFFRDSLQNVVERETFCPWKVYTPSKLQLALSTTIRLHQIDEIKDMDRFFLTDYEDEREIGVDEIEEQFAAEGMTTHRFLESSNRCFSQFECYSFAHLLLNNRNLTDDCKKLREYFNKLFDDIYRVKEREMDLVQERHERIRMINSELSLMFDQEFTMPADPDWNFKEVPNSIIKVSHHEIKVKPYVSSSQQKLLDKQAADAERLRQLLLADDFREKALMRMMDGVLEVRWEDIIKKDIPKPQCMLTKDPEQYNVDDILAIRQYEKDVEFLEKERLRYRRILESELDKINIALREGIDRFNVRLIDFFLHKMRVEAAIQQLNFRNLRGWLRHTYRIKAFFEDDEVRKKIDEKQKLLDSLGEELHGIEGILHEYRSKHEALLARERTVGRKFRSDFPSVPKSTLTILERECKRRPRLTLKNATPSDFLELGKTVVSHGKLTYLTHECMEYMKYLERLEVRPVDLPQSLDDHHWDHLIRLRRNRIELEMKIKAEMAEIHETEKTISGYRDKIDKCHSEIAVLRERLVRLRAERIDFDCDMEIQIVLKMGQVEVTQIERRDGHMNALLIPASDINCINKNILTAGEHKIRAMYHTTGFRRGILFKEWEHKCMKMTIQDLEEDLHTLEGVLVTRDMRDYLNRRTTKGFKDDKTTQQWEKELEAIKMNCEKRLNNWVLRLKDVENRITRTKNENELMDKKITRMNVDRCELELQRDPLGESKEKEYNDRKMAVLVRRSKLMRKLQKEFTDLLVMQTEHELLRMRRFPTLGLFKTLGDEKQMKNRS